MGTPGAARLMMGDCLEVMRTLDDASADAVVTDPPAGISFMGKAFDHDRGGRTQWIAWLCERMAEAYRVAKPGTYALVWALPRTSHWTATAVEDAGWTIRDVVVSLTGQGFPKAKSCLKPGSEHWILAYKPGGPMAPLQIDACRIETADNLNGGAYAKDGCDRHDGDENWRYRRNGDAGEFLQPAGRWPANVVLTCCGETPCEPGCAVAMLDEMSGKNASRPGATNHQSGHTNTYGWAKGGIYKKGAIHDDSGGASRFFYTSKASRADRGPDNNHPTVKSTALMQWLCRLITPPAGTILDPFMGSGSTGKAAAQEGFGFIGIEQDPSYHAIAESRIAAARRSLNGCLPTLGAAP